MIRQIIIFLTITAVGIAQPDLKFDPFDWTQYRQVGKVNSITFGDRFAYIGTQSGGIMRLNIFAILLIIIISESETFPSDSAM